MRGEHWYRPRITNEETWRQDGTPIRGFAQNRGEENVGINQDSPITDELIARFSGGEDSGHFEEVAWWWWWCISQEKEWSPNP